MHHTIVPKQLAEFFDMKRKETIDAVKDAYFRVVRDQSEWSKVVYWIAKKLHIRDCHGKFKGTIPSKFRWDSMTISYRYNLICQATRMLENTIDVAELLKGSPWSMTSMKRS